MRHSRLLGCGRVGAILLASAVCAHAAPVTLSGTITYTGPYSGALLHVAAIDTAGPTAYGSVAVAVGSPPFAAPFVLPLDNSGIPRPFVLAAVLDVDGSGFHPDSLENAITYDDVLGWYAGGEAPTFVDAATSHSGLDFELPTAEIRGTITFYSGQPWAEIEPYTVVDLWSPRSVTVFAAGPYAIRGLYAGNHIVVGWAPPGEICYGDATCITPTIVTLANGEIRTGVDLDFSPFAVEPDTWGRIKAQYR